MRYGLLVLGIAVCLGLSQGWIARAYDQVITAALSEEARLAIDVRCRGQNTRAGSKCRAMLRNLYLSGALDPDRTLRVYCDSAKIAQLGGSRTTPPKLCVQLYGGWRKS